MPHLLGHLWDGKSFTHCGGRFKVEKKQLKQDGLQLGSHLMQKQREACQDLSKLLLLMRNLLWNN